MSYNKFGEYELLQDYTGHQPYCITRDRAGYHVLREGNFNGKELFSPVADNGKKNTKKGRVYDISLLLETAKKATT